MQIPDVFPWGGWPCYFSSHAWVIFSNFLSTPSFNFSAAVIWKEYIWINDYDGGCQSTTAVN